MGKDATSCSSCGRQLTGEERYLLEGNCMCEDCAMEKGLFPLEHTGSRRDRISERGRRLTLPER